jgi:hypothetical protein
MKNCSELPMPASPQKIFDWARAIGVNFTTSVAVCSRTDFTYSQYLDLSWRRYTGLIDPAQETVSLSAAFPIYTVAVVDEKIL